MLNSKEFYSDLEISNIEISSQIDLKCIKNWFMKRLDVLMKRYYSNPNKKTKLFRKIKGIEKNIGYILVLIKTQKNFKRIEYRGWKEAEKKADEKNFN